MINPYTFLNSKLQPDLWKHAKYARLIYLMIHKNYKEQQKL